jgi:(1->4)-alpha-D-glucan 1-alpha-D-glucosylmutase
VLLASVCQRHRRHRDHTRHELREALRTVLGAFGVYRTYVRVGRVTSATDRRHIDDATRRAGEMRPDIDAELLTFLGHVLAGEVDGDDELELALRFQQVSSPVMAKGVEDTAFYRYNRLVSLNEVGGDPSRFGTPVAELHAANVFAAQHHPLGMLTLSTHDTKRSSDVRTRIHLLAEIPDAWAAAVQRWHALTAAHRRPEVPDPALEQLIYQTLIGAWPIDSGRLVAYLEKATKEAKLHTTWTDPNPAYDDAVRAFATGILADDAFLTDLDVFVREQALVELGRITSLAQTTLLLTSPGVPDIYQGTEVWDLSLVDPDNRRPVDFERQRRLLDEVRSPDTALRCADEGGPKLWLIERVLADRAARPYAYAGATYEPIVATGPKADHVIAFARVETVVVVPRLLIGLGGDWEASTLVVPDGRWRDVVTGIEVGGGPVPLADLLARFPVAVLAQER